jgi:glycosyltransferase involved in cell wall biosynthesis
MKILYVTFDFQHPLVPGSHRHYHFIKELSKRHKIVWLTLASRPVPAEAMDEMRRYTREMNVFSWCFDDRSPASKLERRKRHREAINALDLAFREVLESGEQDVVLFHGQKLHALLNSCKIPVVIDMCDANSMRILMQARYEPIHRLPANILNYLVALRRERKILSRSKHIALISARDRTAVAGESSDVHVVPNGVDAEFWCPTDKVPHCNTIAMTGEMSYRPNTDAAMVLVRKVMPILRRELDNPKLLLIGRAPPSALEEAVRGQDDITLTGYVDDVRPWVQQASLFAAPIRFASGMQNKVLEAMAMKLPVVTTAIVEEGLRGDSTDESPAVVAGIDNEREFADAIIRLLGDPADCASLGEAGRVYVRQHFSWVSSALLFERMCQDAMA